MLRPCFKEGSNQERKDSDPVHERNSERVTQETGRTGKHKRQSGGVLKAKLGQHKTLIGNGKQREKAIAKASANLRTLSVLIGAVL